MTYLKCALVGIITGVSTAVAWLILRVFMAFREVAASDTGGLGSVSGGVQEMLVPGIVGFALGFYLTLRRQQAPAARL